MNTLIPTSLVSALPPGISPDAVLKRVAMFYASGCYNPDLLNDKMLVERLAIDAESQQVRRDRMQLRQLQKGAGSLKDALIQFDGIPPVTHTAAPSVSERETVENSELAALVAARVL